MVAPHSGGMTVTAKNEALIWTTVCTKSANEANQSRPHTIPFHLRDMSRMGRSTETEKKQVAARVGERTWWVTASSAQDFLLGR